MAIRRLCRLDKHIWISFKRDENLDVRIEAFEFLQLMEVSPQRHLGRIGCAIDAIALGKCVIEIRIRVGDYAFTARNISLRVIDLVKYGGCALCD